MQRSALLLMVLSTMLGLGGWCTATASPKPKIQVVNRSMSEV